MMILSQVDDDVLSMGNWNSSLSCTLPCASQEKDRVPLWHKPSAYVAYSSHTSELGHKAL